MKKFEDLIKESIKDKIILSDVSYDDIMNADKNTFKFANGKLDLLPIALVKTELMSLYAFGLDVYEKSINNMINEVRNH